MKERIICEKIKKTFGMHPDYGMDILENSLIYEQKVEQVPENWEDLKELCENIKCCYVGENYISVSKRNISFLNDGQIRCNYYNITNKATPQQMWQIIKSLIGE